MVPQVSSVRPEALAFLVIMSVLALVVPRRWAMVPILGVALLIPLGQQFMIAGLHFYLFRIIMLVGLLRVVLRGERPSTPLNAIDKTFVAFVLSGVLIYCILFQTTDALVFRLGMAFNALFTYFLVRCIVRDPKDWAAVIRGLAYIMMVIAACMVVEHFTGRNMFSYFGGVPEFTEIRAGRLRCQGPFAHTLLAGACAAVLVPIFISLPWVDERAKWLRTGGIIATTTIALMTSSSGPFLTVLVGCAAMWFFPFRRFLGLLRWVTIAVLVTLHLVMEAPVWALIGRIKVFDASTGYHRFHLLDQFIRRFGEWWMLGVKTTEFWGDGLTDITNMFVRVGIDGGLLTLVLFLAILWLCFRAVGVGIEARQNEPKMQKALWALGACLFANIAAFFDVEYFDQTSVILYMLPAIIAIMGSYAVLGEKSPEPVKEVLPPWVSPLARHPRGSM